jgi:hypothetical protein
LTHLFFFGQIVDDLNSRKIIGQGLALALFALVGGNNDAIIWLLVL